MCFRETTLVIGREKTRESKAALDDIGVVERRHHEVLTSGRGRQWTEERDE
jgi:hypothetical protein